MILHLNKSEKRVNYDSPEQRALIIAAFLQKFPVWANIDQDTSIEKVGFLDLALPWMDIKIVLTNLVLDIEIRYAPMLLQSYYPSEEIFRFSFSALPVIDENANTHTGYTLALRSDLYSHEHTYWAPEGEPVDKYHYSSSNEDPEVMWQRQLERLTNLVADDEQTHLEDYYEVTYSS